MARAAEPVPIYPPARLNRLEEYAQRHAGILRNAEARLLITFRQVERVAGALAARGPSLGGVTGGGRPAGPGAAAPTIPVVPQGSARGQYAPGCTGQTGG